MTATILYIIEFQNADGSWEPTDTYVGTSNLAAMRIVLDDVWADSRAFRVAAVDLPSRTMTDATNDVLDLVGWRSKSSSTVPAAPVCDMLDAAGIDYFTAENEAAQAREAAAWERQLQSLRPSIATHI